MNILFLSYYLWVYTCMRWLYDVVVPLLSKNITVLLISVAEYVCEEELAFVTDRTALWLTSIIKLYLDGGQKEEKDIDGERKRAGRLMYDIGNQLYCSCQAPPWTAILMHCLLISDIFKCLKSKGWRDHQFIPSKSCMHFGYWFIDMELMGWKLIINSIYFNVIDKR